MLYLRVSVLPDEERCFATFDSDPLTIPQITTYTVYYAPNTEEGKWTYEWISEQMDG